MNTPSASDFLIKEKCKTLVVKGCYGLTQVSTLSEWILSMGNLFILFFIHRSLPQILFYFLIVLRHPNISSVFHMIFSKAVRSTFWFLLCLVPSVFRFPYTTNNLKSKTSNACHIIKDFGLVMIENWYKSCINKSIEKRIGRSGRIILDSRTWDTSNFSRWSCSLHVL